MTWTDSAPPPGWTVPAGYTFVNLGLCRGCRAPVAWCRTPAGRSAPSDRDGISHFATCPQVGRFRPNSDPREYQR